MGIGNTGDQGGRNQRADIGDVVKAPTELTRSVPGKDTPAGIEDPEFDRIELVSQRQQTVSRLSCRPITVRPDPSTP